MKKLNKQACHTIAAGVIQVADNLSISEQGISARCLPKLRQAVQMQFTGFLLPHEAITALSGFCTEQDMQIFGANILRACTQYIEQLTARIEP